MWEILSNILYRDFDGNRITFLLGVFKCLRFFGLVPNYNFKEKRTTHSFQFLIFGILIFIIHCYVYIEIMRILLQEGNSFSVTLSTALTIIAQVGFYFYNVLHSWYNQEEWETFLEIIFEIESYKNMLANNKPKKRLFCFNRIFIEISLVICLAIYCTIDYCMCIDLKEKFLIFVPNILYSYTVALTVFLISTISLYFKYKLDQINQLLFTGSYTAESVNIILTCNNVYMKLATAIDLFNNLIGKRVLVMIGICSNQVLCLWYLQNESTDPKFRSSYMSGSTIIFNILVMLSQFCLTFCCDLVVRAAEKLLVTCYNVQEKFKSTSNEYKELENFANKLVNRRIKFTADHYFELNRSTVFGLFFNITTYYIALVQFSIGNSVQVDVAN